ncbi:glycosyltransferase family 4 protein [Dechloromonas sp. HYN0024]|uniref:glycosyltransferase family 4 protein n=1 Tax=Dechloromonas sp. HYN0024 TaxID=2231055 RepID=UPI000E443C30|nr:glycosyltransferase family 4 protein [Dechloromonas sp. HYN0024]AXS80116.1 glycosyltransferase family 1 protein [Dechloromonas sp. HYN0024]
MPQKILIATILRPEGDTGVQSHFRAFLSWLEKKALPASLVTPYNCHRWQVFPTFALRRLIDPFCKPGSVWWYRHWHQFFLKRAMRAALADGKPCSVYAQCPLSAAAALSTRKTQDQRVVMVAHFNISQADEWAGKGMIREGSPLYRSIQKFEADVLPRVDGLIFVSDFMRGEVTVRIPATASVPYRIVPNFLADPYRNIDPKEPEADLICIGTLEPRKNQRYALEIVAAAKRLGRRLSLTVVGDGPDRSMLEALAVQLGIGEQVAFAGYVSNAVSLMPLHRAFLHVALMESFGIVLIEAMAYGLPVFAPAVGGIPEVFIEGSEGRFIPFGNADTAARFIIDLLDSPQAMKAAQQAARERFLAHFESARVAEKLAGFLGQESRIAPQMSARKSEITLI